MYEDVKITDQEIADIMANDIIKREVIDSEESKKAKKDIEKLLKKFEKAKEKSKAQSDDGEKTEGNEVPETPA
jgi:F0F1-type ATP synthase epsilon subunit